jgi:hypothetical protein
MKRTQLQLEDPVYEALRRRAYESRTSMAGLVREAVKTYLGFRPRTAPSAKRPAFVRRPSFIGCIRTKQGALSPVSERHDEALARAYKR